jgi:hypothetical protein
MFEFEDIAACGGEINTKGGDHWTVRPHTLTAARAVVKFTDTQGRHIQVHATDITSVITNSK